MSKDRPVPHFDILVIGSGAAGLTFALCAADRAKVAVVSKGAISGGSTRWAQGGIAAVLGDEDSVEAHVADTLRAGAGLCREDAVRFVVERGPAAIAALVDAGMGVSRDAAGPKEGELHLTREGGHSRRRVVHAADTTGQALEDNLEQRARQHPNIALFENQMAVDLITRRNLAKDAGEGSGPKRCYGAYIYDRANRQVAPFTATVTVLATGGASKVYLYTSNPDGTTGDGIALAWRAGCRVGNMEFNQFHPTCLYHPDAKSFLISEALRGEGAILTLPSGERFMDAYHEKAELAPRDIVARAIDHEMKRRGLDHMMLDISHKPADFIIGHFPMIYRRCREFGFDITQQAIPVVPAAHYTCGGIVTGLDGRTDLDRLYAIGECAHIGLHGANRMASNSLLECLVLGQAAAEDAVGRLAGAKPAPRVRPWDESQVTDSDEEVVVSHNWNELRHFMWDYVGIVRTDKRLRRAMSRANLLQQEIEEYYGNFRVGRDLLELRNLVQVAELIIRSAMARKESRGLHFTTDYPDLLPEAVDTILAP